MSTDWFCWDINWVNSYMRHGYLMKQRGCFKEVTFCKGPSRDRVTAEQFDDPAVVFKEYPNVTVLHKAATYSAEKLDGPLYSQKDTQCNGPSLGWVYHYGTIKQLEDPLVFKG